MRSLRPSRLSPCSNAANDDSRQAADRGSESALRAMEGHRGQRGKTKAMWFPLYKFCWVELVKSIKSLWLVFVRISTDNHTLSEVCEDVVTAHVV